MPQITMEIIYLMGGSFILGSLCTVFLLLILDMSRVMRNKSPFGDEYPPAAG